MSSRLDTSECSRSASASIVLLNDCTSSVDHSTSGAQQARRRGLDVGERRPEVVRHRREQGVAQVVRLGQRGGGRGFGLEPQRGLHELQLGDERAQQPSVLGRERTPRHGEHRAVHELGRVRGVVGCRRCRLAGRRERCATRRSSVRARRRSRGRESRRSSVTSRCCASSSRMAVTDASSASASTSAWPLRELCAAAREPVDETAHERRHRDEHDEGQRVSGVGEPETVRRRDVEPVGEQEGHQRRGDRRDQPAQHRDRDRADQEQQQGAGHAHRVAQRDQREHHERNADEGTDPGDRPRSRRAPRQWPAAPVRASPRGATAPPRPR